MFLDKKHFLVISTGQRKTAGIDAFFLTEVACPGSIGCLKGGAKAPKCLILPSCQ